MKKVSIKKLLGTALALALLLAVTSMPESVTASPNLVGNPGFETGAVSPWTGAGTYSVVSTNASTGTRSARVEGAGGNSAFNQTITGLSPNTAYLLSGWFKAASGNVSIGVKNYGGTQIAYSTASTSYKQQTIAFTTGASNTSAQIFLWKGDAGYGYGDDFSLTLASSPVPTGIPGSWNLAFNDEFNGTSLDTSVWNSNWFGAAGAVSPPVNAYETAAYDPAQVSVGGGSLSLATVSKPVTVNGTAYPYRSGLINSNGHKQFTYGAFEARIYLPASGAGVIANWPAFWTDGQNWPTDGEMDIMEGISGQAQYHFHSPSGGPGGSASGDFTGWHTYGADWESGSVNYYYDGALVGTISSGITSSPMYLILDYAIGMYGGPTLVPATMKVDYVRVWQH
ncbi:family 16 glycosylhydrolase [Paenibacillus rhizovicinus]|uniref:Family 16 glycosylhydrolase n=1 Tax=Paenibacillus rhizovicinus TaxID=2704463 RepID=A0A6C0NXH9_9BACL|nr:family 16 glycosylhydrolase [Paenibacillus rhizovicinus]QHW30930.1 family 16 glycosylhydrolase [Paenibacillus rhizovicinus]